MKPADCTCREVLVDYVKRTVGHPRFSCPHYGTTTPLDPEPDEPEHDS